MEVISCMEQKTISSFLTPEGDPKLYLFLGFNNFWPVSSLGSLVCSLRLDTMDHWQTWGLCGAPCLSASFGLFWSILSICHFVILHCHNFENHGWVTGFSGLKTWIQYFHFPLSPSVILLAYVNLNCPTGSRKQKDATASYNFKSSNVQTCFMNKPKVFRLLLLFTAMSPDEDACQGDELKRPSRCKSGQISEAWQDCSWQWQQSDGKY